jgi:glycosyltransferase involved in cell wall biosynthesis
MKVLYIGYYREASEWGRLTCDKILALDSAGVDVACRSVILGSFNKDIDPRIVELEQKETTDCDVCIQHVFPHDMVATDHFKKNIGIFETDAITINDSLWATHLDKVKEVWVPNSDLKELVEAIPNRHCATNVVNHCCDYDKFTQKYPEIQLQEAASKFKFYTICEASDIKNLDTVIKCFHSEFDRSEPVILIMKVSKCGFEDKELKEYIDKKILEIKTNLRMYSDIQEYKRDIVITENLSNDNLNSLHQYGDCFINVSHGEAWSSTTFDAVGFGSSPICSNIGGHKEYVKSRDCGILVDGGLSVCKCYDAAFPDTFTGRNYWFEPFEDHIKSSMRFQYDRFKENPIETSRKWKLTGLQAVSEFTRENIGRKMREILEHE